MNGRLEEPNAGHVHRKPDFRFPLVTACDAKDEVRALCVDAIEVHTVDSLRHNKNDVLLKADSIVIHLLIKYNVSINIYQKENSCWDLPLGKQWGEIYF